MPFKDDAFYSSRGIAKRILGTLPHSYFHYGNGESVSNPQHRLIEARIMLAAIDAERETQQQSTMVDVPRQRHFAYSTIGRQYGKCYSTLPPSHRTPLWTTHPRQNAITMDNTHHEPAFTVISKKTSIKQAKSRSSLKILTDNSKSIYNRIDNLPGLQSNIATTHNTPHQVSYNQSITSAQTPYCLSNSSFTNSLPSLEEALIQLKKYGGLINYLKIHRPIQ
ncbi:hypothetical protein BDF19DRAFT_429372 [Syncephalis fuscata]|nr:hypothetical protein BDF19DRAFT_429372 [Syncephalis fuscata]